MSQQKAEITFSVTLASAIANKQIDLVKFLIEEAGKDPNELE